MPLLQADEALRIAREIVAASPADETEVTIESTEDRFVRFADVGPTQSADRERLGVAVRVRLVDEAGRREARAVCGSADPAETARAVERAVALARVARPDAELLELGGPVTVEETAPVRATVDHGFAEKARWVEAALARCGEHGLAPAGLAQTTAMARTLASSTGREVHGAISSAGFALTASGERGSGFGSELTPDASDLDPERVIDRAVQKAVANADPRPIEAGEYTVVLEPHAVSALLLFACYRGFGAQEVVEQASFLCGRTGERVFSEALSVVDDAAHPLCGGFRFDGEGSPRQRVVLVDAGVPTGPVTDRAYAAKLGSPNTGHGRPQPCNQGPRAQDLVVASGAESLDELVAGVDRGLLVTQFHYTNLIEPRELLLTGMTRNGTFLIEDGALAGPVRNLRFTQSLVEALGRVTGIGAEAEVAGALFEGRALVPPLRIDGFRFSSTTDF